MQSLRTALIIALIVGPALSYAAPAPHLVISEVQVSGATGFSTDEFIELYNPTDTPVDVATWSLVKRTAAGAPYPLVTSFESAVVPAHGYFLIAHPTGYTGAVVPDARYDTTNSLAADNSVELVVSDGIVDLVGWGSATHVESAPAPTPGSAKSIERKARATATSESMAEGGEDMFRGNGEDANQNDHDWVSRSTPEPQATSSELEFITAAPPQPVAANPAPSSSSPVPELSTPPTVVVAPSPHHVVLTEVLPDPTGPDSEAEFVELQNTGDAVVDLSGWKLNDSSKAGYTFRSGSIPPGAWLTVRRGESGIALNNTGGETVTLTAPDGVITSTVAWKGAAPENQSYALIQGAWQWTRQLTPGKENVYEDPNRPPVATIRDLEPTVRVRATLTFSAADATDPDGDDLECRWTFSDGARATGTVVRHAFAKPGKATAELTVVDPKGKSGTATVALTVLDYDRSTKLSLTAAMPNPAEGEEEWVEVRSTEARAVDLTGWSLRFGKKVTNLEGSIAAQSTRRWGEDELRFALRNDGGTLELLNADRTVVSALVYGTAKRGDMVAAATPTGETSPLRVENHGVVAGEAVARGASPSDTVVPPSGELPRWVWLAVAAAGAVAWAGYAGWYHWKHRSLPKA